MSILEALKRERPRRIHDMVIPRETGGKDRVEFDVEKEVGEVEWKGMYELWKEKSSQFRDSPVGMRLVNHMALLRPEEKEKLRGLVGRNITTLNLLYQREDMSWEKILEEIQDNLFSKNYNIIFLKLEGFSYRNTHKIKRETLTDMIWDGLKREVQSLAEEKNWSRYLYYASEIRLLFPEKFSELDVSAVWSELEHQLVKDRREKNWERFALHAGEMKILAAKEAHITENGIELVMNGRHLSHEESIPPRPVRENFTPYI